MCVWTHEHEVNWVGAPLPRTSAEALTEDQLCCWRLACLVRKALCGVLHQRHPSPYPAAGATLSSRGDVQQRKASFVAALAAAKCRPRQHNIHGKGDGRECKAALESKRAQLRSCSQLICGFIHSTYPAASPTKLDTPRGCDLPKHITALKDAILETDDRGRQLHNLQLMAALLSSRSYLCDS